MEAGSPKVLLIEDTKEVREVFSDFLDILGCDYSVASDGAQGLAMLERSPYDLVITDLKMPGLGGLEVARAARQRHPGIEVIVLSGSAGPEEREQINRLGLRYLGKPIMLHDFIAAVRIAQTSGEASVARCPSIH
jgi:CheY-like chemotaxis protein